MRSANTTNQSGQTISRLLNPLRWLSPFYQNPSSSNLERNLHSSMSKSNAGELIIFDTGALIQIHTLETFSSICVASFDQARQVGMCYLAIPEIAGATGSMLRNRRITKKQREHIQNFLTKQLDHWLVLPVSYRVCNLAYELCQKHPLKGGDAIHLAAVKILLQFRHATFLTLDKALYEATKKEKVPVVVIPRFEDGR